MIFYVVNLFKDAMSIIIIYMVEKIMLVDSEEKIEKIIHISDIHISPIEKKHSVYKEVFKKMYELIKLESKKGKITIVVTGDILDSKDNISDTQTSMVRELFFNLKKYGDVIVIIGNHDLSSKEDRASVIKNILNKLDSSNENDIFILNDDATYRYYNINFCVTTMFSKKVTSCKDENGVHKIALWHGCLGSFKENKYGTNNCMFSEKDFEKEGFSYCLFGDNHQCNIDYMTSYEDIDNFAEQQKTKIIYSGSLIQQSIKESHKKGFVIIDLEKNREKFVIVPNSKLLYGVRNNEELKRLEKICDSKEINFTDIEITFDNKISQKNINLISEKLGKKCNVTTKGKYLIKKNDIPLNIKVGGKKYNYKEITQEELAELIFNNIDESDLPKDTSFIKNTLADVCKLLFKTQNSSNIISLCRLEMDGFTSFGKCVIDFMDKQNSIIAINSENGTGKTSILNAIIWSLYGVNFYSKPLQSYKLQKIKEKKPTMKKKDTTKSNNISLKDKLKLMGKRTNKKIETSRESDNEGLQDESEEEHQLMNDTELVKNKLCGKKNDKNLINNKLDKMQVRIVFKINDTEYVLIRSSRRTNNTDGCEDKVTLFSDNKSVFKEQAGLKKQIEDFIVENLGTPDEMIQRVMVLKDNFEINFSMLTAQEKLSQLSLAIGISELDKIYNIIKMKRNSSRTEKSENEQLKESIVSDCNIKKDTNYIDIKTQLIKKLDALEEEHDDINDIDKLNKKKDKLEKNKNELIVEKSVLESKSGNNIKKYVKIMDEILDMNNEEIDSDTENSSSKRENINVNKYIRRIADKRNHILKKYNGMSLEKIKNGLKKKIEMYEAEEKKLKENIYQKKDYVDIHDHVAEKKNEIKLCKKKIEQLKKQNKKIKENNKTTTVAKIENVVYNEVIDDLKEISKVIKNNRAIKKQITIYTNKIKKNSTVKKIECDENLDEEIENETNKLVKNKNILEKMEDILETEKIYKQYVKVTSDLELENTKYENITEHIELLKKLDSVESNIKNITKIIKLDAEIENKESEIVEIKKKISCVGKQNTEYEVNKTTLNNKIKQITKAITAKIDADKRVREYDIILESINSSKGVYKKLLEISIPKIEKTINDLLSIFNMYTIKIILIGDGIHIVKNEDTNLQYLSTSEMRLLNIVYRIAVSCISKTRYLFFVVDEILDSFSQKNKEIIKQLLDEIKNNFLFTLIVSHDDKIKKMADVILEIRKEKGISYLTN